MVIPLEKSVIPGALTRPPTGASEIAAVAVEHAHPGLHVERGKLLRGAEVAAGLGDARRRARGPRRGRALAAAPGTRPRGPSPRGGPRPRRGRAPRAPWGRVRWSRPDFRGGDRGGRGHVRDGPLDYEEERGRAESPTAALTRRAVRRRSGTTLDGGGCSLLATPAHRPATGGGWRRANRARSARSQESFARALDAAPDVLTGRCLAQRAFQKLFLGQVGAHAAPSRQVARRSRSCRRARWISFFTFCRGQPMASAMSP